MATTSILQIQEDLLDNGHKFLLSSRLTQDCLENLFSVVRLKNPVPSLVAFKCALEIISIAQFMKPLGGNHGSYQDDDTDYAVDFLSQPIQLPSNPDPEIMEIEITDAKCIEDLSKAECNSLYHLVGYCLHSIKKNEAVCEACLEYVSNSAPDQDQSIYATLTSLKEFKKNCLEHVTDQTFEMMVNVELMFRSTSESTLMTTKHVKEVLIKEAEKLTDDYVYPSCHNIKRKLMAKYFNVRLHIFCKELQRKRKQKLENTKVGGELESRSMAMRTLLIKNVK